MSRKRSLSPLIACAVSATTGIAQVRSSTRSCASASMPSIPGSCTSISTSAGSSVRASSTASSPVVASSVLYPLACSTSRTSFMFVSLSSTTRIRSPAIAACLLDRKREHEAAPMPGLAFDPDAPSVQFDETLRERESEAGALALPYADVRLLELLEDPFLVVCRDTGPGVRHRDQHLSVLPRRRDDDASAPRRELDRVREQVEDDLLDAALVTVDKIDVGCELERDEYLVLRRPLPHHHHAALQRLAEREGRAFEFDLPGLDLGQVENLVDQAQEVIPRCEDVVEVLLLLRVERPE